MADPVSQQNRDKETAAKTQIDIITVLPGIIVTLLFCAVLRCVT